MITLDQIDRSRVPQHVAIIMDGNGRWAMKQQHERLFGHQNAFTAVRQAVEAGVHTGVKYLTLYTFSTENWTRPEDEVAGLMELLIKAVREETKTLMDNNVKLTMIGDIDRIPEKSRVMLQNCIAETSGNTAMTLILALSYSSRWEIAEALKNKGKRLIVFSIRSPVMVENLEGADTILLGYSSECDYTLKAMAGLLNGEYKAVGVKPYN